MKYSFSHDILNTKFSHNYLNYQNAKLNNTLKLQVQDSSIELNNNIEYLYDIKKAKSINI